MRPLLDVQAGFGRARCTACGLDSTAPAPGEDEILKSESARTEAHPIRSHPVQAVLKLLAVVGIIPLSGLLFIAELVLRRGGTVEVDARRRPLPAEAPIP
jgi:hypothetical protein